MSIKLRDWQSKALLKARQWYQNARKQFLLVCAPASGKTLASCAIAQSLIADDEIDRVIVIAPQKEVVSGWASDFERVTGRYMGKVTGTATNLSQIQMDVCATWAAVQGLQAELQAVCRSDRVLVICDENHHAAIKASWGDSAESAFSDAKYALILSGTPIRSDGEDALYMSFDGMGGIDHPTDGSYVLTYGEAVDLGYCRPTTFHLHEGKFQVDLDDGETIVVTGHQAAELSAENRRVPGLQSALDFYRLAKTPKYEADDVTPSLSSYHSTMVEWGSDKLDELRLRMPDAGGLVIAPNIDMAEYFCALIERMEGERPMLVHSGLPNAESMIKAYRHSSARWLVSVAMVSEGVDLPRLRVLIYLPNALTELAFRQAIGRVVRTRGTNDDTRAYVVMPSFDTFDRYARRVENEMSPAQRRPSTEPKHKRCPVCEHECELGAKECPECGHEFPQATPRLKQCQECGALNKMSDDSCQSCGHSFQPDFVITLREAMRDGVIARGMAIDEVDVVEAERIAEPVRDLILRSGDVKIIEIMRQLPLESYGRLANILDAARDSQP